MHDDAVATYPPLNTLKRVADNVWIVDGPVVRFGLPWPQFPFPTRMTVIRLASGELSCSFADAADAFIAKRDRARGQCPFCHPAQSYPLLVDPGLEGRIPQRESMFAGGYPWDAEIATLPIAGGFMTEVEFFQRASRTLILTDLIETSRPDRSARSSFGC